MKNQVQVDKQSIKGMGMLIVVRKPGFYLFVTYKTAMVCSIGLPGLVQSTHVKQSDTWALRRKLKRCGAMQLLPNDINLCFLHVTPKAWPHAFPIRLDGLYLE
jgi:hypothetical protein